MTPILSFKPGGIGITPAREVVRLGAVVIGEVSPHAGGARARAVFSLQLPELRASFRPAASIEEARRIIAREVAEWLLRVGVFYPGQALDVDVEAADGRGGAAEARVG